MFHMGQRNLLFVRKFNNQVYGVWDSDCDDPGVGVLGEIEDLEHDLLVILLPFKQIVQLIDKQKYRVLILLVCDYLLQKLQLLLERAGDDLGQLFEDEVENGFWSFKGHRI